MEWRTLLEEDSVERGEDLMKEGPTAEGGKYLLEETASAKRSSSV